MGDEHRFRAAIEAARGGGAVALIPPEVGAALGGNRQMRVTGSLQARRFGAAPCVAAGSAARGTLSERVDEAGLAAPPTGPPDVPKGERWPVFEPILPFQGLSSRFRALPSSTRSFSVPTGPCSASPQVWQRGHQYVMRACSPCRRPSISVPQRRHGWPARP